MRTLSEAELDLVAQLVEVLGRAYKARRIYGLEHLRTQQTVEQYCELCERLAQLLGPDRTQLPIAYHEERFFLENMPLPRRLLAGSPLRQILEAAQHGGFVLTLRSDAQAMHALLDALEGNPESDQEHLKWLSQSEIQARSTASGNGRSSLAVFEAIDELRVDVDFCDSIVTQLAAAMESCAEDKVGDIKPLLRAGDELVERFLSSAQRMLPVTTIPYFDHFTYHHSLNVALLTLCAAQQVVTEAERLKRICQAALLHDLGKSRVPTEILYKPDRLSAEEIQLVQRHPSDGAELLSRFTGMDPLAVTVAYGHHIKDGGHGYPSVPAGFHLGAVTRLVEVVDIFEALTAHRPYKKSLPAAQAFEVLYSSPHMESFRPYMDMLLRSVGYHPIGSRVRSADGEIGVVVEHEGGDPTRPIVRPLAVNSPLGTPPAPRESDREHESDGRPTYTPLEAQEDEALLATV